MHVVYVCVVASSHCRHLSLHPRAYCFLRLSTAVAAAVAVAAVVERARAVRDAFAAAGLPCDVVTGGGTGTFTAEAASGVFTGTVPTAAHSLLSAT